LPDLNELLESIRNPDLQLTPVLPPAEVRRRGNRIRRRNNALATVGGLAVIAIIATPFALAAGGSAPTGQQAPVASQPSLTWTTAIPTSFHLDAGMGTQADAPHVGHEPGEVVFSSLAVCGREVWTPQSPASVDTLGAAWSDGVEGGEQRTLAVYSSDRLAQGAVATLGQAVRGCSDQSTEPGDYTQPIELTASAGDDALAWMEQYGADGVPTGEANAYVVTRVGNALLLDKTYFGGGGSVEIGQQVVETLESRAAPVVDAMCVFATEPCTT
jgi:hypothetical protein